MLSLLYLAGTLAFVNAEVTYFGPESVRNGTSWTISCTGFQGKSDIYWTKNGVLPEELSKGDFHIEKSDTFTNISTDIGLEIHEGVYKCARSANNTFRLIITTDIIYKVVPYGNEFVKNKKGYTLINPVPLQCGNSTAKDTVEWTKDGKVIDQTHTDIENWRINESRVLELLQNNPVVIGNYTCQNKNQSFSLRFRVVPNPVPKFENTFQSVVEGEKLTLNCGGNLYPGIKIEWEFNDYKFNTSEGRYQLSRDMENGVSGGVLTVSNMKMTDSGHVGCRVYYEENEKYNATVSSELKVKDKLAALWPFLGICAEVAVLCAIIVIYERKRNKAELEESDTDQSPDTKPTPNKDSEVRQRK
ncbi:neuroplastin [Leptopilina heterotoma]|uniref:neuroplastin n=1 Tax=Leptopilina heterotoma TaxID=63436 RepID=UPI001CA9534D|nr:neuroplastin [Leptopilina heterotoma]